jgi:hypothetical protein
MNNPDSPSGVKLNVIALHNALEPITCSFYEERKSGVITAPLETDEMPASLKNQYDSPLYTDFRVHSDAPETSEITFGSRQNFSRHYLNWLVYNWFKGKVKLRRRNFVNQNEFYILKRKDHRQKIATFDRYIVKADIGCITDGPELVITYIGETRIWLRSILDYPGDTRAFSKVAYNGHVYNYKYVFNGRRKLDRNKLYPVINREIASRVNIPFTPKKVANRVKFHSLKVNEFFRRFIQDEDFIRRFNPADEFLPVKKKDLKRIHPDAANLEFGKGVVEKDPHTGMKKGGPYLSPETPHFRLFFIVAEQDKTIAGQLFRHLRDGLDRFPGLNRYAQIPVHFDKNHIFFKDANNPFEEIRRGIAGLSLEDNVQYGAIYISPFSKFEQDERKFRVYYKLKEELLKHSITSQFIYRKSVQKKGFKFYLPNISVALLAKLGGIPWTLEQKTKKELVIGMSAYSPFGFRKTYLGSAFCFSNRGEFRGFNSFTADDNLMLAGSFQKAIYKFREENDEVERIVIHFYKRMNRREAGILQDALKEMKLDVPLVILTIHKSGSTDYILTDTQSSHGLPLSGTFMRSGEDQYLLCNNTRYTRTEKSMRSYPTPLKIYFDMAGSDEQELHAKLEDEEWVYELIEQVYQFSRLNWQSITVKSHPVTIRYPELVAQKFPYFSSDTMPEFGKRNFWFL